MLSNWIECKKRNIFIGAFVKQLVIFSMFSFLIISLSSTTFNGPLLDCIVNTVLLKPFDTKKVLACHPVQMGWYIMFYVYFVVA